MLLKINSKAFLVHYVQVIITATHIYFLEFFHSKFFTLISSATWSCNESIIENSQWITLTLSKTSNLLGPGWLCLARMSVSPSRGGYMRGLVFLLSLHLFFYTFVSYLCSHDIFFSCWLEKMEQWFPPYFTSAKGQKNCCIRATLPGRSYTVWMRTRWPQGVFEIKKKKKCVSENTRVKKNK